MSDCVKRKLCTTSAENGRLRCARPASIRYTGWQGQTFYACTPCRALGADPPDGEEINPAQEKERIV